MIIKFTWETPKSLILTISCELINRLPGLISLCITLWLCKYSRPSSNCVKYLNKKIDQFIEKKNKELNSELPMWLPNSKFFTR